MHWLLNMNPVMHKGGSMPNNAHTTPYLSSDVQQACADVAEEIGVYVRATDWVKGEIKNELKKLSAAIIQQVKDTK